MKRIILASIFSLVITQAFSQVTQQKGGHCYTLDIPDYMVKTFELNDVASSQFMNSGKEAYAIVIEDSKELLQSRGLKFVNAKDFLESFLKSYNKDAEQRTESKITESIANGNNIAQAEVTWKDEKATYFMITTAVESKTHFYKVMTWTTGANKGLLKADLLAISRSLKD
jgi:hypothetical protein